MKIEICERRRRILEEPGHLLVLGGPGSGKTTIALLKARERWRTLEGGQEILFLSFSRGAVRQILFRCKELLTQTQRDAIQVRTYHSFCLEMLESHGRLLRGCPVRIIHPGEERLRKLAFDGDWTKEQRRLAVIESVCCFDLFADRVATLLERSRSVVRLIGNKYPLVIVDEFQDSDDDQWRIVQAFADVTTVFCLADPDQRIFDYRPNVDAKRIDALVQTLKPTSIDLRGENHRSPAGGILAVADAVLKNTGPLPTSKDVRTITYYPKNFDATVHMAIVSMFGTLKSRGVKQPCVGVLGRTNVLVAKISNVITESHVYVGKALPSVEHDVIWDAELSAAAAQVAASIMEWQGSEAHAALTRTAHRLCHYFRLKNAENPSKSAAKAAATYAQIASTVEGGKYPTRGIGKTLAGLVVKGVDMSGDPMPDWGRALGVLAEFNPLAEVCREARLVRLFRASETLGRALGDLWIGSGTYAGAAGIVKSLLDRQQLLAVDREPRGCVLMNMYKSKGKEFDGVVLVEGSFSGRFFDTVRESPPYEHSRRLLRVALTRARTCVTMVRPHDGLPLG